MHVLWLLLQLLGTLGEASDLRLILQVEPLLDGWQLLLLGVLLLLDVHEVLVVRHGSIGPRSASLRVIGAAVQRLDAVATVAEVQRRHVGLSITALDRDALSLVSPLVFVLLASGRVNHFLRNLPLVERIGLLLIDFDAPDLLAATASCVDLRGAQAPAAVILQVLGVDDLVDEILERLLRLVLAMAKDVLGAAEALVRVLVVARALVDRPVVVHFVLQHDVAACAVVDVGIKCPYPRGRRSPEIVSSLVLRHLKVYPKGELAQGLWQEEATYSGLCSGRS